MLKQLYLFAALGLGISMIGTELDFKALAVGDGGTKSRGLNLVFCLMIWGIVTAGGGRGHIGDHGGLSQLARLLGRAPEACRIIAGIVDTAGREVCDGG